MLNNKQDSNSRKSLGFVKEVREHFSFLETQWDFQCIQQEDTFVRYASDNIHVDVYHGRASFEIGVEIGKKPIERSFSLEALVTLFDEDLSREYWATGGRTTESIRKILVKAAEGLRKYGDDVLSGNQSIFDRLDKLSVKRVAAMVLDSKTYQVRPKAEAAFKRGDYENAVKLYSSIEEALSSIEKIKLKIAKGRKSGQEKQG